MAKLAGRSLLFLESLFKVHTTLACISVMRLADQRVTIETATIKTHGKFDELPYVPIKRNTESFNNFSFIKCSTSCSDILYRNRSIGRVR